MSDERKNWLSGMASMLNFPIRDAGITTGRAFVKSLYPCCGRRLAPLPFRLETQGKQTGNEGVVRDAAKNSHALLKSHRKVSVFTIPAHLARSTGGKEVPRVRQGASGPRRAGRSGTLRPHAAIPYRRVRDLLQVPRWGGNEIQNHSCLSGLRGRRHAGSAEAVSFSLEEALRNGKHLVSTRLQNEGFQRN